MHGSVTSQIASAAVCNFAKILFRSVIFYIRKIIKLVKLIIIILS